LRKQLQRDAEFVDGFTVALSDVNRSHLQQERTERAASLRSNLNMLPYLHVATLGLVLLVMLIVWRLIFAARERERQDATQASILNVVDDGMIGVCEGGNVVFSNAASEAMLDHAIMQGCPLPRPTQRGGGLLGHVRSLLKEGERLDPETFTARRAVQLGEGMNRRHYSLRLSRSREWLGSPSAGYAYVITMRDVTVEVEAAQQSAQYEAGLARVSRVMSYAVISGGLVHEISQPLAALRNYLHVLRSSPECAAMPEPRREILGHLGVEADRISEIIRNVRAMGPQEVKLDGSCYLSEAVARSVRLLSLGATPPPAISIKTAAGADLRVRGSLPLIGQVIINLIRNALQASAASGDSGAVVFLRRFDGFAEISIADFGKGVSPEAAGSMFEPFCQSERGGMGLGLAICQRIAANLGGSIGWKNREAGGTVFTFKVPLAGKELTA
jgi:signal transduction histidine kinase